MPSDIFDSAIGEAQTTEIKSIEKFFAARGILVAEDNEMNLMLISEVLNRMGFQVLKARTGAEAVAMAAKHNPELIFMDIHMPGMDGFQAAKTIRSLPAPNLDVIIVALTADAMKEDKEKCLAVGMNDYVAKPFRITEIEQVLKRHLKTALPDKDLLHSGTKLRNGKFLLAVFFSLRLSAQEPIRVNSDRPDETDGTYIIQKGYLQFEHGFFFEKESTDGGMFRTYGLQDAAVRLGIMERVEFQLLYSLARRPQIGYTKNIGIASAKAGLKYEIWEQKGNLPSFSAFGSVNAPFLTSKEFRTANIRYLALLLFQHELKAAEIGFNLGISKERDVANQYIYTISFVKEFSEKFSGYIEQYSSFTRKETEISFDTGLGYAVNDLLVLDIAAGITVNENSHFLTIGFAYLLPTKLF